MQTVVHSDLLPTAEEVQSLQKEFGLGFDLKADSFPKMKESKSELLKRIAQLAPSETAGKKTDQKQPRKIKKIKPVEHTNFEYVRLLEEREEQLAAGEGPVARDFMHQNQLNIKLKSTDNRARRRAREEKLRKFCPTGFPLYLFINSITSIVVVCRAIR